MISMIKQEEISILINQLNNYKGLIRTGDKALDIMELKLKQLLNKQVISMKKIKEVKPKEN